MSTITLGWISDDRGVPCVLGKRITDAASFLTQRILVGVAKGAANAFSESQVTPR